MTAITEWIGWAVTAVALAGVILNNHRRRECFLLWLVSNAASTGLHLAAGMWALTARDAAFFALAIYGWYAWGKKKEPKHPQISQIAQIEETEPKPESVESAKSVDNSEL